MLFMNSRVLTVICGESPSNNNNEFLLFLSFLVRYTNYRRIPIHKIYLNRGSHDFYYVEDILCSIDVSVKCRWLYFGYNI